MSQARKTQKTAANDEGEPPLKAANDTLEEIESFARSYGRFCGSVEAVLEHMRLCPDERVPAFWEVALREAESLENLEDLNWVDDGIGS